MRLCHITCVDMVRSWPVHGSATNATSLWANGLILQSDVPLPPLLKQSLEREAASLGLNQDIDVRIHCKCAVPVLHVSDSERQLGWVDLVDGQVLSIIHIDCARIGQAVSRIAADLNPPKVMSF